MKDAPPRFTAAQVTGAIRAAYSPRWDTSLSPADAITHAATYRSIQAHYRRHIRLSLDDGDYLQAAEKSWGAFTQAVKAIGADHRIKLSSHVGIFRVAGELSDLIEPNDADAAKSLKQGVSAASSLHTHFYENNLPDAVVTQSAGAVADAIDLLQDWFPTPPADDADADAVGDAAGL